MAKAAPKAEKGGLPADTSAARYWLLERVATGGMAELFKARVVGPEGFDKLVAVKRILPAFSSNEEFVKMFIDEARLAANLNHPHIVQVFELGRDIDDNLFISMELVNGVELGTLLEQLKLKNKAMPEAAALEITIQVLRGLQHAHQKKDLQGNPLHLVHRDVSPQNVLVTAEGVAKLLDFGVAKAKGRLTETQAGMVKGKLLYMSPEQSRNKAIDGRTDQFAAALVLWECLAGEPCYTFNTEMDLLLAVGYGQVRTLEDMGLEVNPELESALMTALEPKPENRFPDCEEFANALLRYKQRNYPSFTPTMLGKLVSDACHEQIAKLTAVPDLESKKAIPLKVADVEVSNFSSAASSRRSLKYALVGGAVGLLGLAGGGAALYYTYSQPPPDVEKMVVHDGAPGRTITITKVVQAPTPPPPPVPIVPDAGDCDGGDCDGGAPADGGELLPDGGVAPMEAAAAAEDGGLADGGAGAAVPPAPQAGGDAATAPSVAPTPVAPAPEAVPAEPQAGGAVDAGVPEKKRHSGPRITHIGQGRGEIIDFSNGNN